MIGQKRLPAFFAWPITEAKNICHPFAFVTRKVSEEMGVRGGVSVRVMYSRPEVGIP